MQWQNGRQLEKVTKGSSTYTFTYDAEGRRTSKQWSSGRNIQYLWDGDLLIGEYVVGQETITYSYDASGSPVGFTYTDLTGYYEGVPCSFLYRKNAQGDIIGIVDSSGNEFVKYNYDAWGNLISYTMHGDGLYSLHYNMAEDNPFRYRGYYYDKETGFYYLKSRYYDPAIGRFLNASGTFDGGLLGNNQFAYCDSNLGIHSYICSTYTNSIINSASLSCNSGTSSRITKVPVNSQKVSQKSRSVNSQAFANSVFMTNVSVPMIDNELFGMFLGNITFTTTTQHNNAAWLYSYVNVGDSTSSAGLGLNVMNWYGISAHASTNFGVGANMQITPWFTFGAEISILDGFSVSFGTISNNVTNEVTTSFGWLTIATAYTLAAGISSWPIPGARLVGAGAAIITFCVDIFS